MADGAHIHEPDLDESDLDEAGDFGGEDVHARDIEILDELAELGLALARGLQAQALAAETPEQAARLATGFERTARTVRHCIALKGRVRKDAYDEDRSGRQRIAEATRKAIARRKAAVNMYMREAILAAEDDDEDEDEDGGLVALRLERLRARLDETLLDESFLEGPISDVIAILCEALHLPVPESVFGEAVTRRPSPHAEPDPPDGYGSG